MIFMRSQYPKHENVKTGLNRTVVAIFVPRDLSTYLPPRNLFSVHYVTQTVQKNNGLCVLDTFLHIEFDTSKVAAISILASDILYAAHTPEIRLNQIS